MVGTDEPSSMPARFAKPVEKKTSITASCYKRFGVVYERDGNLHREVPFNSPLHLCAADLQLSVIC